MSFSSNSQVDKWTLSIGHCNLVIKWTHWTSYISHSTEWTPSFGHRLDTYLEHVSQAVPFGSPLCRRSRTRPAHTERRTASPDSVRWGRVAARHRLRPCCAGRPGRLAGSHWSRKCFLSLRKCEEEENTRQYQGARGKEKKKQVRSDRDTMYGVHHNVHCNQHSKSVAKVWNSA